MSNLSSVVSRFTDTAEGDASSAWGGICPSPPKGGLAKRLGQAKGSAGARQLESARKKTGRSRKGDMKHLLQAEIWRLDYLMKSQGPVEIRKLSRHGPMAAVESSQIRDSRCGIGEAWGL